MTQDPNLYGDRSAKRQKKEVALPSSLAFTASLSSLISKPTTSSAGRARPSKAKSDIFSGVKVKRKVEPNVNDESASIRSENGSSKTSHNSRLHIRAARETEDEQSEALRGRRKMEEKARIYAAMQRGDYVPKEGDPAAQLVDFDRKWAERQDAKAARRASSRRSSSSDRSSSDDGDDDNGGRGDDNSGDENDAEIISYEDEFGRLRHGTRAEKERMERRLRAAEFGAQDLERMSARPAAPRNLIFGDTIQAEAFVTADEARMEDLARKRDRSATPPEMKHYDGNAEIRTKGVGFFRFSKDEETRKAEMANLERERIATERQREERERVKGEKRREIEKKRREMEARRREVAEKRAKTMADSFLDGLASDLAHSEQSIGARGEKE